MARPAGDSNSQTASVDAKEPKNFEDGRSDLATPASVTLSQASTLHSTSSGMFYYQNPEGVKVDVARGVDALASPITATHTMFTVPDSPGMPDTAASASSTPLKMTCMSANSSDNIGPSPLVSDHASSGLSRCVPSEYLNATIAHSRGCSDVAMTHMPDMYNHDNNRPRSRSDAPKSPGLAGYSPPKLGPQALLRISSERGLAAPSPQRRLFPEANSNMNGWPLAPNDQKKLIETSPFAQYSQAYNTHIQRLNAASPATRGGTPGGVQLPCEPKMPAVDVNMAVVRQAELSLHSAPANGSGLSPVSSHQRRINVGSDGASVHHASNHSGHVIAEGEAQGSQGLVKTSSTSPKSDMERRAKAKYLAALIRSGAAEDPADPAPRNESYRNEPYRNEPYRNEVYRKAPSTYPSHSTYQNGQNAPMQMVTEVPVPIQPFVSALSQPTVPYMEKPDPTVIAFMQMGRPGYKTLQNLSPFTQPWKTTGPSLAGVVKLTDIPYNTTRAEVVAFFGRNARLVAQPAGSPWYAIHIIMERATAKSMDCYVEFETPDDAHIAVSRIHNQVRSGGRHPRIGERKVGVQLSSQEELMREIFPRAKCVQWHGQNPVVQQARETYSSGFQGFVSSEEMHMTVKYAVNPQRSRFAVKHIQRTYESMISLMNKAGHYFPWWAHELYTVAERNRIWKATRDMVFELAQVLRNGFAQPHLDFRLLEELLYVALSVPSFSEQQRAELMDASMGAAGVPRYVSQLAKQWPFETVRRGDESSEELLQYYAALLKQVSGHVPINEEHVDQARKSQLANGAFGMTALFGAEDLEKKTMAAAALVEWSNLDSLLRQGAGPDPSPTSSFSSEISRAVTT